MPRSKSNRRGGGGHRHTSKSQRKASNIEKSERKRGMSPARAKRVAWATVHKDMSHKSREKKER